MLATIAGFWGSSFLLTAIALDHFGPGLVALMRLIFAVGALAAWPAARRPVARRDWPAVVAIGVLWMTLPFVLFPLAQERIDSSFAGMLNAGVPLYGALFAAMLLRRRPGWLQGVGLLVGFVGVLVISLPSALDEGAAALGIVLAVLGSVSFALATNLVVPLQQRYGALPVLLRAQLVGLVIVLPYGVFDAFDAEFAWGSVAATVGLGSVSAGFVVVLMSVLVGRVGAARGGITMYFIPIVAIVLGVSFRDESIELVALLGIGLVLVGAFLTSRIDRAQVRAMAKGGVKG